MYHPERRTDHGPTQEGQEQRTSEGKRAAVDPDGAAAEDKIRIILEGLRGDHPVAELCRQEGISANLYYVWLKEFMEAGKSRLKGETLRGATKGEVELYRRQNDELRQTVADLMLEVRALKKSLF